MSTDGPDCLVDAVTGQPVCIDDLRQTVGQGDALRYEATLIDLEAPTRHYPKSRVHIRYGDGATVAVAPNYVGCVFVEVEPR